MPLLLTALETLAGIVLVIGLIMAAIAIGAFLAFVVGGIFYEGLDFFRRDR